MVQTGALFVAKIVKKIIQWRSKVLGVIKYSKQDLVEDALKYNSRGEWQKKSKKLYLAAYSRQLIDVCCAHMTSLLFEKWTLEVCKSKGRMYKKGSIWKAECPSSYSKASRKNWLPLCLE